MVLNANALAPSQAPEPTDLAVYKAGLADALIQLGQENLKSGHLDEAQVLFQESVKLQPRHISANYLAGETALELGQPNSALPYFEVAVQEGPMHELHWIGYIRALIAAGAIDTATQAIQFGTQFGLSTETATQLATDFIQSRQQQTTAPPAPAIDYWSLSPAPPWPTDSPSESDLASITPPESRGRRYVIVSPLFRHNSAGIRVLHNLQQWLVRAGYDAVIVTSFSGLDVEQFEDDIAIYPEVVFGNPLLCRRVVRYLLNLPGKLSGDKTFPPHELVLAHSVDIAQIVDKPVFYIPSIEPFFFDRGLKRTHSAFYVGKGKNTNHHPADSIQITHAWPSKRRELAEFLNRTHTVYLYDDMTVVSHEAKLCGCQIFLIRPNGDVVPYPTPYDETPSQVRIQLHRFISLTQSL